MGLLRKAIPFFMIKDFIIVKPFNADESIMGDYAARFIRAIPIIIPLFELVEIIMLFVDDEHPRFGDKWGKTKVIQK